MAILARSLAGRGAAQARSAGEKDVAGPAPAGSVQPFLGPYRLSLTASAVCGQPSWTWGWNGEGRGSGPNSVITLPGGYGRVAVRIYYVRTVAQPRRVLLVLDLERAPTDGAAVVTFYSLIGSVPVPRSGRPRVSGLAPGQLTVWSAEGFQEQSCTAADHVWELAPR